MITDTQLLYRRVENIEHTLEEIEKILNCLLYENTLDKEHDHNARSL